MPTSTSFLKARASKRNSITSKYMLIKKSLLSLWNFKALNLKILLYIST